MASPEWPDDIPSYDPVKLEAEQLARASEFEQLIKSLATLDARDEDYLEDDEIALGAHFDVSGGKRQIDVQYKEYTEAEYARVSMLQIAEPWREMVGADGLRRRARLTRYVLYAVENEDIKKMQLDEAELPNPPEELVEAERDMARQLEIDRLERGFDPYFRPPELVRIWQGVTVEAKLPNSPNYRTERVGSNPLAQQSILAIQRQFGESMGHVPYTIDTHNEVVALLQVIKSRDIEPQPLAHDFDNYFMDPF